MQDGGCHSFGAGRKREFLVGDYLPTACGDHVLAVLPKHGPCGSVTSCRVGAHHLRERKTGPGFALQVVRCAAHGRSFTVYPPGYVPYGRMALADGGLFGVASDAAQDTWPGDEQGDGRWRQSQYRWLALCGLWLGLGAGAGAAEQAAVELSVSLHEHRRLRVRYEAGGYRERGAAIVALVEQLGPEAWCRLLRVGYTAGLCGRAFALDRDGLLTSLVHSAGSFPQRE